MLPTPRDPEGVDVLPCSFAAATRGDRWPISAPPAGMAARMAAFMASGSTGPPGWPGFTACVLASRLPLAAESGASAAEGSTAVAAAGSPPMLAPGRGAACSGLPGPMGGYSRLTAADSVVCEGGAGRGPGSTASTGPTRKVPATMAKARPIPVLARDLRGKERTELLVISIFPACTAVPRQVVALPTGSGAGACIRDQRPAPIGHYPNTRETGVTSGTDAAHGTAAATYPQAPPRPF